MYGVEVSDEALAIFDQMYMINSTWTRDEEVLNPRRDNATNLLITFIEVPVDESMSGILWLFPSAVWPFLRP
jgi:hypothetical protein